MKKYNLSVIMKRAWEIKREHKDNIFATCLKMAWEEIKSPKRITMNVIRNETFTIDMETGMVTGKTYHARTFLKENFNAKWDGYCWTIDIEKLHRELTTCAGYYKKYIVAEKEIASQKLVNRYDGFYSRDTYADGSVSYTFVG